MSMLQHSTSTDEKILLIEAEQTLTRGGKAEQRVWRIRRDGSYAFSVNDSELTEGRFSRETTDRLTRDAENVVSCATGIGACDTWECGILDENGETAFSLTVYPARLPLHRITELLLLTAEDRGRKKLPQPPEVHLPELYASRGQIRGKGVGNVYTEYPNALPWMEIQETEEQQTGDNRFRSYTISRDGSVFDLSMFGQIYLPELEKGGRISPETFAELESLTEHIRAAKETGFRSAWEIRFFDEDGHLQLQTEEMHPENVGDAYALRNRIGEILSGLVFPSSTFE